MSNDTEEQYKRLLAIPGVFGLMVINLDGIAIKSTLDNAETLKYCGQVGPLVERTRKMVRELVVDEEENAQDDVKFIRLRTKHHEVLIAPEADYALIVLQTQLSTTADEYETFDAEEPTGSRNPAENY